MSPVQHENGLPRVERRFVGWIVGVVTTMTIAGISVVGSLLWNLNTQVAVILVDTRNLKETVGQMQVNMTAGTAYRYTSQDAAADRSAMLKIIEGLGSRLTDIEKDQIQLRLDFERHVANGSK